MDQEERHRRIYTLAKWGIGVGALAILAPVIFMALKGLAALVALLVLGSTTIALTPWFAMKLANWKVKSVVKEATDNPIETLQNDYIGQFKEVEAKDQELTEWDTELRNFDDELAAIKRDYPQDAKSYVEVSETMHNALRYARHEQGEARIALEEFANTITKMKRLYKMALAAQRVTRFSKSAEDRVMADIKRQAALDSVRNNVNGALARLNSAMAKRQERPALPAANTTPITAEVIEVSDRVIPIGRKKG